MLADKLSANDVLQPDRLLVIIRLRINNALDLSSMLCPEDLELARYQQWRSCQSSQTIPEPLLIFHVLQALYEDKADDV